MEQLLDFTDKVVIVTGARTGIGQATAIKFAKQGAKVVLSGRKPCDETEAAIKEFGGECTFVKCDVSIEEDVKNLIDQTVATYGRLDVAVNNAGYGACDGWECADWPMDDYDITFAIDVRGLFMCMKAEIPEMLKVGGGAIINISSVAGLVADPGLSAYCGAKHAVSGITRGAGIEYADRNIRINGIAPGFVDTPMNQALLDDPVMRAEFESFNFQKRTARPDEIAGACLFLASDLASFINGIILPVDAGQTAH